MYWLALSSLLVASVFDVRQREIPNTIPIALLALSLLAKVTGLHPLPWSDIALGVLAAFAISTALFAAGGLGGGDVKLLTALGAALGARALLPFAIVTGLIGGLAALFWRWRRRGESELPYAPVMLTGLLALLPALWLAP